MATQRNVQLPFDASLQLDDGLTPKAATGYGFVGGAAFVFDIMAGAPGYGSPPNPDVIRYGGVLAVDMLSVAGTDTITLEGAVDTAFTVPVTLATTQPITATGVAHIPFNAQGLRYLRVKHTVVTGPATAICFLVPYDAENF